jgi:hypothetical protein
MSLLVFLIKFLDIDACYKDKWCSYVSYNKCIPKEFLCSQKGKFIILTSKYYWNLLLKGKDECSKNEKCAFKDGVCLSKEFWCKQKGKFNFFTIKHY